MTLSLILENVDPEGPKPESKDSVLIGLLIVPYPRQLKNTGNDSNAKG